jgi:hypothetical protein
MQDELSSDSSPPRHVAWEVSGTRPTILTDVIFSSPVEVPAVGKLWIARAAEAAE